MSRRHVSEDSCIHSHHGENLRSHKLGNACTAYRSRRSSFWQRNGQTRNHQSVSGRGTLFVPSNWSRPALGPIQPTTPWVSKVKRPERKSDNSHV